MSAILVWYLMYANVNNAIEISPPVATINDCQSLQANYENIMKFGGHTYTYSRCVQVSTPVTQMELKR